MTFEGVSALVKSSITLAFHALVWADALRKYLHAVNRNAVLVFWKLNSLAAFARGSHWFWFLSHWRFQSVNEVFLTIGFSCIRAAGLFVAPRLWFHVLFHTLAWCAHAFLAWWMRVINEVKKIMSGHPKFDAISICKLFFNPENNHANSPMVESSTKTHMGRSSTFRNPKSSLWCNTQSSMLRSKDLWKVFSKLS